MRPGAGVNTHTRSPRNTASEEIYILERNPYNWQVDPEGNQLPYIDTITHRLFETVDVFNMWIINGEIDFQARGVGMKGASIYSSTTSKPLPRMITVWNSSRIASLTTSMRKSLISGMTLGAMR